MSRTRLSSKGQLVLPKAVRDALGLRAGDELTVTVEGSRVVLQRPTAPAVTTLEEVIGCLHYAGPPLGPEEMDAAIARGAREQADRERSR